MLSKSRYCSFIQCPKRLWLSAKRPELAAIDASVESKLDAGNEIGDLAMGLFGDFVEVTAYREDGRLDLTEMISRTAELVNKGQQVICEASFSFGGSYCAVDILKREGGGYAIYEVKSSSKPSHIYSVDVAYQKYVLENCGIKVTGTYLVLINSDYVFDGTLRLSELFRIVDISRSVEAELPFVAQNVSLANSILKEESEPAIDISESCEEPYKCPFFEHCTSHLPNPSVFDLYGIGFGFTKKLAYYRDGICSFEELSGDKKIMKNHIRSMQITHALSDLDDYIDKDGIKEFLDRLSYPIYFLDFETMQQTVPEFVGSRPGMHIPFQYSLHYIEREGGELLHREFLAESGEDPRRAIAERLCLDIPMNVSVIAYNKSFECSRLAELAELFPDLSEHLLNIAEHVEDLYEPFRKGYYYNRRMGNSFSIKSVLPAIFPDDPALDYHNLEGVHNGSEAMTVFPSIKNMSPEDKARARANLLKYCELDTYATVKLWEELKRVTE